MNTTTTGVRKTTPMREAWRQREAAPVTFPVTKRTLLNLLDVWPKAHDPFSKAPPMPPSAARILKEMILQTPEDRYGPDQPPPVYFRSNRDLEFEAQLSEKQRRTGIDWLLDQGFIVPHDSPTLNRYARGHDETRAEFGFSLKILAVRFAELLATVNARQEAYADWKDALASATQARSRLRTLLAAANAEADDPWLQPGTKLDRVKSMAWLAAKTEAWQHQIEVLEEDFLDQSIKEMAAAGAQNGAPKESIHRPHKSPTEIAPVTNGSMRRPAAHSIVVKPKPDYSKTKLTLADLRKLKPELSPFFPADDDHEGWQKKLQAWGREMGLGWNAVKAAKERGVPLEHYAAAILLSKEPHVLNQSAYAAAWLKKDTLTITGAVAYRLEAQNP